MITELKSETARANGAQSHGPATPEGKAASSQNSLKHGFCARQVVLPGEDKEEFDRHRAEYMKIFQPRNQAERDLVETMVAARWRLNRAMAVEANLLASAEEPKDILKNLSLLTRYENQLNRTYDRAYQYLMDLKANLRPVKESAGLRNEPKPMSDSEAEIILEIEKIMREPLPNEMRAGVPRNTGA